MNVVLIIAVYLLSPVFGRALVTEKTKSPEDLAKESFTACGSKLNDVYKSLCELPYNVNISKILRRSKRGVVDECCRHSCRYIDFSEYCPGKTNFNGLLLENELRATTRATTQATNIVKPTTAGQPTNEVRKKGKTKARRDGRWRRQPIVMPCMYRSYAHFLLRERRRLQGKIKKKERTMSDSQHGAIGLRTCETCSAPQYQASN